MNKNKFLGKVLVYHDNAAVTAAVYEDGQCVIDGTQESFYLPPEELNTARILSRREKRTARLKQSAEMVVPIPATAEMPAPYKDDDPFDESDYLLPGESGESLTESIKSGEWGDSWNSVPFPEEDDFYEEDSGMTIEEELAADFAEGQAYNDVSNSKVDEPVEDTKEEITGDADLTKVALTKNIQPEPQKIEGKKQDVVETKKEDEAASEKKFKKSPKKKKKRILGKILLTLVLVIFMTFLGGVGYLVGTGYITIPFEFAQTQDRVESSTSEEALQPEIQKRPDNEPTPAPTPEPVPEPTLMPAPQISIQVVADSGLEVNGSTDVKASTENS